MNRREFAAGVIGGGMALVMPEVAAAINYHPKLIYGKKTKVFSGSHGGWGPGSPEQRQRKFDLAADMNEWIEQTKPSWWFSSFYDQYNPDGLWSARIEVVYWLSPDFPTMEEMVAGGAECDRTWRIGRCDCCGGCHRKIVDMAYMGRLGGKDQWASVCSECHSIPQQQLVSMVDRRGTYKGKAV